MDNGTTVEVLKSLNYYQLAKFSLVSKRFRDFICNNRHRLALLYISGVRMDICFTLLPTKIFAKKVSHEQYNEWVVCNQYSKQILLENQMAGLQTTQHDGMIYQVIAFADPFIYLHEVSIDWTAQKYCFNLLTGIINPERNRLQCHAMKLYVRDTAFDFSNLITWVKCHLLCDELEIHVYRASSTLPVKCRRSDYDEELLDFIMTGGHCSSAISVTNYGLTSILYDLAVKFMDLKNGDECQVVQYINGDIQSHLVEPFKRQLGKFIVKEKLDVDEINGERKELVFEFVNKNIEQKCQFTATYY